MSKHGCYNRKPLSSTLVVQDGWTRPVQLWRNVFSRKPLIKVIPNPNSKDCQYSLLIKNKDDPKCQGCIHKQEAIHETV